MKKRPRHAASRKIGFILPANRIQRSIFLVRGKRVMFDDRLARIYGVSTARLNQQVKRNLDRFPEDFMFRLNSDEMEFLILQNATSNSHRGGRRQLPYAFTEHGAIMLATVLRTPIAVKASIQVVRAFARLRELLVNREHLTEKLNELERRVSRQGGKIRRLFDAIRELMEPLPPPQEPIGFRVEKEKTHESQTHTIRTRSKR